MIINYKFMKLDNLTRTDEIRRIVIIFDLQNIIEMEQILRSAFHQNNWDLVKLVLLNKCDFLQIQHVIGLDQFMLIIPNLDLVEVEAHQVLQLQTTNLYYFITGGLLGGKKFEKLSRLRSKKVGSRKKAVISNDVRSPLNFSEPIEKGCLSKIQDFFDVEIKSTGFYYCTTQANIIIKIKQSSVSMQSMNKLKSYFAEKTKFLNRLHIFSDIPRNFIQQSIDKFLFTKVQFNDVIYSKAIRPQNIFFLMKGQVIVESEKKTQGIIVKAPNVIGLDKLNQNEQARCLTEYCISYNLRNCDLEEIFKKKAAQDQKQFEGLSINVKTSLRSTYFKTFSSNSSISSPLMIQTNRDNQEFMPQKQAPSLEPLFRNTNKNRCKNICQIGTEKKDRIKQHFSNFLNEKYFEYSTKVQKSLDQNREKPILYNMKPLVPKIPNYEDLKCKLKGIRIKKILQTKETIGKSSSTETLLHFRQSEVQQPSCFYKDSVTVKIQRNLDIKIAKQMNKKYGTRLKIIR